MLPFTSCAAILRSRSSDDGRGAAVKPHANLAGHEALRASDVRGEILVMRREPEPVVDELRVLAAYLRLEAQRLLREDERFQRAMRLVEQHRGGRFVDLARFDPDEAVFDHVDAPHAMLPRELVEALHEVDARELRSVERHRDALLESEPHL